MTDSNGLSATTAYTIVVQDSETQLPSMLRNAQADFSDNTRADENFAREVMQLFSIGLYELNLDGSIRTDPNGDPLPAYTQQDVEEYARVYTG